MEAAVSILEAGGCKLEGYTTWGVGTPGTDCRFLSQTQFKFIFQAVNTIFRSVEEDHKATTQTFWGNLYMPMYFPLST